MTHSSLQHEFGALPYCYRRFASQEVEVDNEDQEHERLHAVTDLDNKASRNVLQKSGFTSAGEGESLQRPGRSYSSSVEVLKHRFRIANQPSRGTKFG